MDGFDNLPEFDEQTIKLANSIKYYLRTNCCGKEFSIKSKRLEEMYVVRSVTIRKAVNYLRKTRNLVGSWSGGYYWIVTEEEKNETVNHLRQRRMALESVEDGVKEAWEREVAFGTTLF